MTSGEAGQRYGDDPPPLTLKGIPVDRNLRIMAVATLVNTFGNGALMTTFALYFTRLVGLRPAQVGVALSAGALAGLLVQVPADILRTFVGLEKCCRYSPLVLAWPSWACCSRARCGHSWPLWP